MAQGPTVITAAGDYTWIPSTTAFPWLVVAAAFAGVALVAVRTRSWRWLAVATAVLTSVDFVHAVAVAWSWAGGTLFRVTQLFEGSSYQMPGWILGFVSVGLLIRKRPRGRQAAACAGASALLFTGLLDFPVLSRSEAPFNGPLAVDRLSVALCLGLGLGVLVAAVVLIRADRPRIEYETDDPDSAAGEDDADEEQAVAALAG
jgi:hypothetical protein